MKDIQATIIISLKNKTLEELFRAIEYSRRKNIKKAVREGVTCREINSKKLLEEGYKLHSKTLEKGGSSPIPKEEWFRRIKDEKHNCFIVEHKKKRVGYFSLMKPPQDYYGYLTRSYWRVLRPRVFATDRKYDSLRIMDYIYWNTILYALKNNYDFVDLGGYQLNARGHLKGINRFKEQWGGEIFRFQKDYPFFKALGRKLVRNVGLFYWLNQISRGRRGVEK